MVLDANLWRYPLDLDDLVVATSCLIDEEVLALTTVHRLRQRGPAPIRGDAEVLTSEVVAEFLGPDQDTAIYDYFARPAGGWFPVLSRGRATFARQAANFWAVKEALWRALVVHLPHDLDFHLVDRVPHPVCRFARAYRCRRFAGQATSGRDEVARQTYYGFRCHVCLAWPGVITELGVAPANVSDLAALPRVAAGDHDLHVGDRNDWLPKVATVRG